MKATAGILGLVIVLAVGYFLFKTQLTQLPSGSGSPKEVSDVVGIKNDLLAIAQSERLYLAAHGTYATIDQLQQDGSLAFSGTNHRGYNFVGDIDDGQHFRITARPSDPAKQGWPTLSIDETMQVTQQ